jgi:hypothetical protein
MERHITGEGMDRSAPVERFCFLFDGGGWEGTAVAGADAGTLRSRHVCQQRRDHYRQSDADFWRGHPHCWAAGVEFAMDRRAYTCGGCSPTGRLRTAYSIIGWLTVWSYAQHEN